MDEKSCLLSDNQLYRQSFDCFCDDFTEVLLIILWFESKICLQCVSQLFQRLVFNKQYVLQICVKNHSNNDKNNLIHLFLESFPLNAFECVLKKCKFINKIIIENKV